jgi:hypothetical protein
MDGIRLLLELLYYLSGPLVAAAAFIGLRQLGIARDSVKLSAKRESYRLAADQVKHYYLEVIPRLNKLDAAIKEKALQALDTGTFSLDKNEIQIRVTKPGATAFLQIASEFVDAFNALEGFAVFFTSGVASEEVAFSSLHETYCNSVRKFLPYVIMVGEDRAYQHLLKLFLLWNERQRRLALLKDKSRIDEHLSEIHERRIRPLGMD